MKYDHNTLQSPSQFHSVPLCKSGQQSMGVRPSFGTELQIVRRWSSVVFITAQNFSNNLHSNGMVVSSITLIISDWQIILYNQIILH